MGKHNGRNCREKSKPYGGNPDKEMTELRARELLHHQAVQRNEARRGRHRPSKWKIAVLLENGDSFGGTVTVSAIPPCPGAESFSGVGIKGN